MSIRNLQKPFEKKNEITPIYIIKGKIYINKKCLKII